MWFVLINVHVHERGFDFYDAINYFSYLMWELAGFCIYSSNNMWRDLMFSLPLTTFYRS